MNSRTTIVLALLLIVAGVAILAIHQSGAPEHKTTLESVRIFPDAKPEDVASITLSRSGPLGTVSLTLSGGKCVLTAPVLAPADSYQAGDLARQLAELSYTRAVALTAVSTSEFGFQPPAATIKFTSAGKEHELLVGGNVGFGAQQFTYVATPGAKEAYLIKGTLRSLAVDEVANFRTKTMIETSGELVGLTLSHSGETIAADKTAAGWTITQPVRTRGDKAALDALASAAQGLTAGAFITDDLSDLGKYGLDKPRLTVVLVLNTPVPAAAGGTSAAKPAAAQLRAVTIEIGGYANLQKSNRYALVLGTPSVITLPEAKVRDLDKDLFTLRDKRILAAEPEQVEKLVLNFDGNAVSLDRSGGQWQITAPEHAPADADEVSSLLANLGNLKTKQFVDGDYNSFQKYGGDQAVGSISYRVRGQIEDQVVTFGKNKDGEIWVFEKMQPDNKGGLLMVSPTASNSVGRDVSGFSVGRIDSAALADCKKTWLDLRDRTVFKLGPGQTISQISWSKSGETISIERPAATGSDWYMVTPTKMVLDGEKVAMLVEAFSNIKAKKWLAKNDKLQDYGLDKPPITTMTISISCSAGSWLGFAVWEKNGKYLAVYGLTENKFAFAGWNGQPSSHIFELDRSLIELLDKPMWKGPWLDFDKERVTHLEIAGPGLTVTFLRAGQEWSSEQSDLAANSMRVNWYLSDLAGLEVARVVRYAAKDLAEFGLDKPAWRIRLKGLTVDKTLLVSEKGPTGGDRYATIAGSNIIVVLDATQVARIVKDQSYFRGTGNE